MLTITDASVVENFNCVTSNNNFTIRTLYTSTSNYITLKYTGATAGGYHQFLQNKYIFLLPEKNKLRFHSRDTTKILVRRSPCFHWPSLQLCRLRMKKQIIQYKYVVCLFKEYFQFLNKFWLICLEQHRLWLIL
jgi:hypothetical protein